VEGYHRGRKTALQKLASFAMFWNTLVHGGAFRFGALDGPCTAAGQPDVGAFAGGKGFRTRNGRSRGPAAVSATLRVADHPTRSPRRHQQR